MIKASILAILIPVTTVLMAMDSSQETGRWVTHPENPGDRIPPIGNSLFDQIFKDPYGKWILPFPFESLVASLRARVVPDENAESVPTVLIPIGRSLHREAAAPDYFRSPRKLITIVGEPNEVDGYFLHLRHRIFIGYQPKSSSFEVISYNPEYGRFEFQLVENYDAGEPPIVQYANRALCMSCHQNGGAIFPQTPWEETNFNIGIASALATANSNLYTSVLDTISDDAAAFDIATDRANYFMPYQLLWRQGCGDQAPQSYKCRAALIEAALTYRLSGRHDFNKNSPLLRDLIETVKSRWAALWPHGILVPTADIKNLNPLVDNVSQAYQNPLDPRPPQIIWNYLDDRVLRGMVTRLAEFFTQADIQRLDQALQARTSPTTTLRTECHITNDSGVTRFKCGKSKNSLQIFGTLFAPGKEIEKGYIEELSLPSGHSRLRAHLYQLRLQNSKQKFTFLLFKKDKGLSVRLDDGRRLYRIMFDSLVESSKATTSHAHLEIVDDYTVLRNVLKTMVENSTKGQTEAFSHAALQRRLIINDISQILGLIPITSFSEKLPSVTSPRNDPSSQTDNDLVKIESSRTSDLH